MKIKKIVIFGYHEIANILIDELKTRKNLKIKLIVSDFEKINSQNKTWYRDIILRSNQEKIKLVNAKKVTKKLLHAIEKIAPDYIFSCFSSIIFPKELISSARIGCLNFHNSDLPKDRGRAAPIFQKIYGRKIGCMSMHWIDEKIDTGRIIDKEYFKIKKKDKIFDLYLKYNFAVQKLIHRNLNNICNGKIKKGFINETKGNYNKWDENKTPLIQFSTMNANLIYNKVNALSFPFKGAFFLYEKKKICVHEVKIVKSKTISPAGKIIKIDNDGILIATKKNNILLQKLEFDKRLILASHLAFILKIKKGEVIG